MPERREACENDMQEFRELYRRAFKKDYEAQRNVAYLLSKGNAAVMTNAVSACAWRLVISTSGSSKVDESDFANVRHFCGRVEPAKLGDTKAEALSITERIAAGGKIDTSVPKHDPSLDGTAEPL